MSIQVNNKNLGHATAYAYAVAGGYTGTEAEFTELLGNIADDLGQIENLTVTVETLAAGSSATASYSNGVLHLGIPKGDKGDGAYHVEPSGESFVIHTDADGIVTSAQEIRISINAKQGTSAMVISSVTGLPNISLAGGGNIAPEIFKNAFTGSVATIIYTIPVNSQITAEQINAQYIARVNNGTPNGYGISCSLSVAVVKDGAKGDTGATGSTGPTGNGIASVAKTETSGLVDTYTITYTNGNTSTFTVTNGAEAVDNTLTIAGRAADAKKTGDEISELKEDLTQTDNALNDAFGVSSLLDDVAFDGKTYREIFEDNNLLPFGDFENGLGWIKTNTNGAVITPEDYCSKSHSLKCFGTSSVQIRKDLSYASTIDVAILCKVKVTRYVSGGGAGFVFSSNHLINHVTDGYETIYSRGNLTPSVASLFVGTVSSANCDAYIDDVRIINLTALFNPVGVIEAKLKTAYDEYIERRNKEYNRRKTEAKSLQVGNPVYIGAVIGASGEEQRFKAMHELLDIAEYASKNPDVAQAKIESVFSDASSGAIIHMPYGNCALYRGANITPIFSKNADVQYIPASTTKVMSVITGLDYLQNLNEVITIKQGDIQAGSGNVFNAGDTLTIKDLLYAMMLPSSNTAAQAFARVCGAKILAVTSSETPTDQQCYDAFINAMNKKAALLGMSNSEFVSASGASSSNKTTANDMIKMMVEACTFFELLKIWGADSYTIAVGGDNARSVTVDTTVTNDALETYYKILGGKTGAYYIDASTYGYALVMVAQAK